MTIAINDIGKFTRRPAIGSFHRMGRGLSREVAATWQGGVVFLDGTIVLASEFIHQYKPVITNSEAA